MLENLAEAFGFEVKTSDGFAIKQTSSPMKHAMNIDISMSVPVKKHKSPSNVSFILLSILLGI